LVVVFGIAEKRVALKETRISGHFCEASRG